MSSSTKLRFVPQGPASLSSDAPGWSATLTSQEGFNASVNSSLKNNVQGQGGVCGGGNSKCATSGEHTNKGPVCWKCKGSCNLPLRAQDVAIVANAPTSENPIDGDSGSKVGKKKLKRLARKRSLKESSLGNSSGDNVNDGCSSTIPTDSKIKSTDMEENLSMRSKSSVSKGKSSFFNNLSSNQRICPVCKGRGYLPIRSRYLNALRTSRKSSSATSTTKGEDGTAENDGPCFGVITSRRRRPNGWKEFGHTPAAVVASNDLFFGSSTFSQNDASDENDQSSRFDETHCDKIYYALSLLSEANGRDDDYDTKRNDVSVVAPKINESAILDSSNHSHCSPSLHEPKNDSQSQSKIQSYLNVLPWLPSNPGEQLCNLVGRWRILQRVGSHRWTTDDLVTAYVAASTFVDSLIGDDKTSITTASTLSSPSTAAKPNTIRYLDLGTGNGSVLQMASWFLLSSLSTSMTAKQDSSTLSFKPVGPTVSLEAVGVEARSEAVGLARRSLSFNLWNIKCAEKDFTAIIADNKSDGISPLAAPDDVMSHNVKVVQGDFRDLVSLASENHGGNNQCNSKTSSDSSENLTMENVASQRYDLITGTPPYFRVDFSSFSKLSNGESINNIESNKDQPNNETKDVDQTSVSSAVIQQGGMPTSMQSAPARCEFRGGVESYCQTASAVLAQPHGRFVVCENWMNDDRVWKGAEEAGLVMMSVLPVKGRVGRKDPLFAVYIMRKKTEGDKIVPYTEKMKKVITRQPLIVRDENGKWTEGYAKVMESMSIPVFGANASL